MERWSPQSAPFPPRPPRKVALPCSAGSQVIRHSPTSPEGSCPPFGLWPPRTGLDPLTKTYRRSPGSRMLFLSVRRFSDYAGPASHSRLAWLPYCLPPLGTESASGPSAFRSSIARPPNTSVYALTYTSHVACKTRVQDEFAVLLSRRALSSPTTCDLS